VEALCIEINDELIKWKDSKRRKPLMITGVRQCGKTYVLKTPPEILHDSVRQKSKQEVAARDFA